MGSKFLRQDGKFLPAYTPGITSWNKTYYVAAIRIADFLGSIPRKQEARNVMLEMWLPACTSGEARSIEAMASIGVGLGVLAFVLKVSRKVRIFILTANILIHRCDSMNTIFLLFIKKLMLTLYVSGIFVELEG
jgi:hypothetical protein